MTEEQTHSDPVSIWHKTGPSLRSDATLPASINIAVAGAGLAGVSAALMLARRGYRVVVFDSVEAGARTTGGSTAKLSVLQGSVYQQLRRSAGDGVVRAYGRAQLAGQRWLQEELADAADSLQPATAFTYATTARGNRILRAEAESMAVAGLQPWRIAAGDIGLPFPVTRALQMPQQAQLHPVRALARLIGKARKLGVTFVDRCRLERVWHTADGVRIQTTHGSLHADRLLVMTGFPVVDRALFFATLLPSRQIVGAYRLPTSQRLVEGMFLSVDAVTRSLRTAFTQNGEPLLVVGGDTFVTGRVDTRQMLGNLDRWVMSSFPGAERERWWAAQDYSRVDRRPFFGAVPGSDERVLAASGFAKWGMTNAVAGALALTGRIAGETPGWAEMFAHPGIRARGAVRALTTGGAVTGRLVSGWLKPTQSAAYPAAQARIRRNGILPVAESTIAGDRCLVSAVCTHLGGVVRWNTAELTWDCPLHGSRFAPDGRVLEGPATRDLPRK